MADDSKQASPKRSRSLETAAAELAKSMGLQLDEIRKELVSEVRTLDQSARVKDFITIIAIRNVKERLRQGQERSSLCDLSSNSQDTAEKDAPFLGGHLPESQFT